MRHKELRRARRSRNESLRVQSFQFSDPKRKAVRSRAALSPVRKGGEMPAQRLGGPEWGALGEAEDQRPT